MKRSKFSEEQVVYAIRQADAGTPVGDLCRQLGVSDATFYAWKKKIAGSNGSSLTSRSTSICCRRPCEKKSKARTPSRTDCLVSRDVSGQLPAGLPLGAVWASVVVSTESSHGSVGAADTDSRSGPCPAPVWVSADLGVAASGRLAGESEARPTTVQTRWLATAYAGATAEAYRAAPRPRSHASGPDGAVEYGFCA